MTFAARFTSVVGWRVVFDGATSSSEFPLRVSSSRNSEVMSFASTLDRSVREEASSTEVEGWYPWGPVIDSASSSRSVREGSPSTDLGAAFGGPEITSQMFSGVSSSRSVRKWTPSTDLGAAFGWEAIISQMLFGVPSSSQVWNWICQNQTAIKRR